MLLQGFGAPTLAVAGLAVFGVTGHWGAAGVVAGLAGPWGLVAGTFLARVWPTAIRANASGIRIGACRRAERLRLRGRWPPNPPPRVVNQQHAVFECPARGVRQLAVVTNHAELAGLYKQARQYRRSNWGTVCLGWIPAPFMRSGLLIEVDPGHVPAQPFRPTYTGRWLQVRISGVLSPTWLVPTRRPRALQSALARLPLPPVQEHIWPARIEFASWPRLEEDEDYRFPPGRPSYLRTAGLVATKVTAFAATTLFLGYAITESITSPGSLPARGQATSLYAVVVGLAFFGSLWLAATTWLLRPWWRRRQEAREQQRSRPAQDFYFR